VLVLPFLNAAAKLLMQGGLPVLQVVWARYAVHLMFALVLFAPRRGLSLMRTRRPRTQIARSSLLLGCTACYFAALRFIELPTAAAINFTAPIIVTVLAVPMLGETVGWRRILAVLFGFVGALVIIRPGLGGVHPAGALVLLTAAMYALYQILTRRICALDSPETSVTYMAVVGTVATSVVLPWYRVCPDGTRGWLLWRPRAASRGWATSSWSRRCSTPRPRWSRRSPTGSCWVPRSWAMSCSATCRIDGRGSVRR
jgi:drug/metabolite transporter (DMT)-like permease